MTQDGEEKPKKGWLRRLRDGLKRSSSTIGDGITGIFTRRALDDAALDDLEDLLITADLGVATAARVRERLAGGRFDKDITPGAVRAILAAEVGAILGPLARPLEIGPARPHVILMVGVNGSGKTTTIGKLARLYSDRGLKVVLAAADTFRAAAIEQLQVWGTRGGAKVVSAKVGTDPAAVAWDGYRKAREDGADVLMIDTAGRLQNKADLMAELEKIIRVLRKVDESAPHDVVLVLDATTGQNALAQVAAFCQVAAVSGLIMTKLDGTARGGVLVAVGEKFTLPIHFIGVGEAVGDLQPFDGAAFAAAIAGEPETE